jgi:F0F1-type ATP synthase delta subunit
MSIHLKSITASKILELIEQFLSETEQQWLNEQLSLLLQKPHLSLAEKQNLIDQLCGAWADDNSILPIFLEIEQQRALNKPREVSF